jgi:transcriptional repressor NrdR
MPLHPSQVLKTQTLKSGAIWRRRKTLDNQLIYTTYETPTLSNVTVIKKNGDRQSFDQFKLFGTIYISFKDEKGEGAKHAVKRAKQVLNEVIEYALLNQLSEITSKDIAYQCVKSIKAVDFYAGMRYASRYQR